MTEHSEAESVVRPTASVAAPISDQAGSLAGRELNGRFTLLEKVASGNRGDVYRADDRFGFDGNLPRRKLAIKVLHEPHAALPGALQYFKRSFHVAQNLSHPNTMSVFDVDSDAGAGLHYMTMELLNGSSLRSILDQLGNRPIPHSEALRITRGACVGLMHMHSRGYVHCDVNPSTLFVTRRLDTVITNFERTVHRSMREIDDREEDGGARRRIGKDARGGYRSPQLLRGESPNNSDDVFALACVCYELFAGYPPAAPPAPVPGLGRRHWNALKKALQQDGRNRTQGITQFARDMGVLTPRATRRGPLFWGLAGATAMVLAGLAATSMRSQPEEEWTAREVAPPAVGDARFSLEKAAYRVSPGETAVRIRVLRNGSLTRPSTLTWWTESDSARSGRQFVDLGRSTLQFDKGQAEGWIFVPILPDGVQENDMAFHVHIGEAAGGDTLGAIRRTSVTLEAIQ